MNFDCSDALRMKHAQFVRDIQEGKLTYCYVTSACEYGAHLACGASGGWNFVHFHKALKDAIALKLNCSIGDEHGYKSNGQPLVVGVCAEQHAANDLLVEACPNEHEAFNVAEIIFSPAIRLKGKQMKVGVMEPCVNCNTIFSE